MKYSYKWLRDISGSKLSPEKMRDALMTHSFEVEGIVKKDTALEGVIVGKIIAIEKHPNADRLRVAKVETGKHTLQIVCGAPNIEVGQKVPLALVGTVLPGGLEIKEAEIRGVKSFGMLCAEDELGLGKNHEGIMVLGAETKIGSQLTEVLGLDDAVLEIDVLSNRAHDALSHVGMAREIATIERKKIDFAFDDLKIPSRKSKKLKVTISNKKDCLRYIGAVVENVKVDQSPQWMQNRLVACGIRPINNIVDITNYVMLEIGQPMHAFDFSKLEGGEVRVRSASSSEKLELLSEETVELSKDNLVIAGKKKPLAVAGVMGGFASGVSLETKTVVFEAAAFDAVSVRKTRMELELKTDASDRFEKALDPNMAEKAMTRAIELVENIAGGKLEGVVDVYPKKIRPWKIKLHMDAMEKLLGIKISHKEALKILDCLNMQATRRSEVLEVVVPTYRLDLKTSHDLMEEIGRMYGYDKIPAQAPLVAIRSGEISPLDALEKNSKNILVAMGFSEVYNYSFYSKDDMENFGISSLDHVELENPMNPAQKCMRISLVPNMLKNVALNLKNFDNLKIFEVGRTYWKQEGKTLPEEKRMLLGMVVVEKDKSAEAFYEAKGHVDEFLKRVGIMDGYFDDFEASPGDALMSSWNGARMAEIRTENGGKKIGYLGEIHPFVLNNFDIKKRVAVFEFETEKLLLESEAEREFLPISKYPTITRDISLLCLDAKIRVADILREIQGAGGDLILDTDLFDIYDSEEGTSYAFRIVLGSDKRTLTSEEADAIMTRVVGCLEGNLGVQIRK